MTTKLLSIWLSLLVFVPALALAERGEEKPKLILVLVFDQFRADYLTRFEKRFLSAKDEHGQLGGFRYLMDNGAYYPQAQHGVLQNMTCPGHAAILTGAYPYMNGIALNDWYDSDKQRGVYCVEDSSFETVGAVLKDPHPGTSPNLLIGTTFGDELKNAGFKSRVISVSLKDRAAILLGGHRADLALWLDADSFRWVSSRYYLPKGQLPDWVEELNQGLLKDKDRTLSWRVSGEGTGRSSPLPAIWRNSFHETEEDSETETLASSDSWFAGIEQAFYAVKAALHFTMARIQGPEKSTAKPSILTAINPDFPHQAKSGDESALFLPFGVEKTVDAAELALSRNSLGNGADPDMLAVSFSTHDFLGHFYGPNSREMEELTVYEDGQVARLLNFVNQNVPGGMKNVLVVLTGDHGVGANPEWLSENRVPAGRIDEKAIRQATEEMLSKKFSKPSEGRWIVAENDLNIYLNHRAVQSAGLKLKDVEEAVVEFIQDMPQSRASIAAVFSSIDVRNRTLPPIQYETQILRSFRAGRSGDVIMIPNPNFVNGHSTATHLTGYSYDRTVPLLLAGSAIRPGRYSQAAQVIDIAPTLSFLTGVIPPSGSEGRVLSESLK